MMASVSPEESELMTTSRSETTTTSATAAFTMETRVTTVSARIGKERPTVRWSGVTGVTSWAGACADAGVAQKSQAAARHTPQAISRGTPFLPALNEWD